MREMDAAVSAIPGIEAVFSQPIRDNVLESISQIDGQIVIKVFGDDLDALAPGGAPQSLGDDRERARAWRARSSTAPGEVPQCGSTSTASAPRATA